MHNVLQILRRDFKRLVTVPAAWVIMIGLIWNRRSKSWSS